MKHLPNGLMNKKKSNNNIAKPTAPKDMKASPPTACWEIFKLNYADCFSQKIHIFKMHMLQLFQKNMQHLSP